MNRSHARNALFVLLALLLAPAYGICEDITGVVASQSPNTLVVKTAGGQYILFVYDAQAVKPAIISNGSTVTVASTAGDEGQHVAQKVVVLSAAPATTPGSTSKKSKAAAPADMAPMPEGVTKAENDISRTFKKYGAGLEGGIGVDPEVILVGLSARFGPIFDKSLSFRPSADFGFGEVTKMFQINLDAAYRLPVTARTSPWTVYAGAGPNFSFVSQNFQAAESGDHSVDFSDFSFKAGLNVNFGMENRNGFYYELRAGVWTIPTLRLMVGYHF